MCQSVSKGWGEDFARREGWVISNFRQKDRAMSKEDEGEEVGRR
jgi:hypothetical protein